jgi:hypothetical protein
VVTLRPRGFIPHWDGDMLLVRSKPDSDTIGVFVIPPGTRTLTVTPVLSRSFAIIALSASSAALDGP